MGARKITVTKAELATLRLGKVPVSLLSKAEEAHQPRTELPGISVKTIDTLMTLHSGGRWASFISGDPSRQLKQLHAAGVTEAQLETVAKWLSKQTWMKSRATLEMLSGHWASWFSQASAATKDVAVSPRRSGPATFNDDPWEG